MKKVLITATVQSHIAQFHQPLMKILHEAGYEIHIAAKNNLTEKNGLKIEYADEIFDIEFQRSPFKKANLAAYKQLKSIININDYNFIHCNTPMGGVVTRIAANRAGVRKRRTKIFYTAHGFHFYKGAPKKNWIFYYPIEKTLARITDTLITISQEDYNIARSKHFPTSVEHIHGVGANEKKYYPLLSDEKSELREEYGFDEKDFICICTGELNKNKNQASIINAIPQIIKIVPQFKLLLAGNGPLDSDLKNLVNNLSLEKHVIFLGYRRDLETFINLSDVVVSASLREGLGLNIIEAMLCGKPIVASENRGHRELVENEVNGFLVSPKNSKEYAEKIILISQSETLLKELGNSGLTKAKKYASESVVKELKVIYNLKAY